MYKNIIINQKHLSRLQVLSYLLWERTHTMLTCLWKGGMSSNITLGLRGEGGLRFRLVLFRQI